MDKGGGEEGEGEMNGESSMDAYTLAYVNREPMRICCMAQEIQTGAGWDGKEDGRKVHKDGDVCIHVCIHHHGWFMLRFDRKQQNSVKQLFLN